MTNLSIDLSNLEIAEVETLNQDGKGLPEFASSCCQTCSCGTCSCQQEQASVEQN